MSATFVQQRPRPAVAVVAAAGICVLLLRPVILEHAGERTATLVAIFVTLGVVGTCWPLERPSTRSGLGESTIIFAIGVLAFAVARGAQGQLVLAGLTARPILLNTLAAIAEEALFRRLAFGVLARYGMAVAILGSACSFAFVHIGVWGTWVVPVDVAAGLLLSWQRAASGRWSIPAITHVAANVLAVI